MRDSAEILTDPPPPPARARIAYGPEPLQFGDLRLPAGEGPFPLAFVLHGGYWQATYNLTHTGHMCLALADAGIATWNLEYRCVGVPGGEWPAAGEDVDLALAQFARLPFDHDGRTVLVGHSAGGQLALWAAKRSGLRVVALAPVSDVRDAVARRGPGSAPARFMAAEHFASGSPLELLPLGTPQVVIHGTADESVPFEMSERYVAAAGAEAELVALDGIGHFELIDPQASAFAQTVAAIEQLL
ncbi:MAG: alpha/beta hydrolase family protein [Gaiellaceae bacterium]